MPNGNVRGSSYARKRRRAFLLNKFGDGETAPCHECGQLVNDETMVVDRIIPAKFGGRYTRDNIQIHCATCSHRQGAKVRKMTSYESVIQKPGDTRHLDRKLVRAMLHAELSDTGERTSNPA
jgi:5-methylcytosine-specific restriction endonuclease McrA